MLWCSCVTNMMRGAERDETILRKPTSKVGEGQSRREDTAGLFKLHRGLGNVFYRDGRQRCSGLDLLHRDINVPLLAGRELGVFHRGTATGQLV